jgi:propionyl-CoA carboxylase alpha chain
MARALVCVAASIDHVREMRAWAHSGYMSERSHTAHPRALSVFIGEQRFDVAAELKDDGLAIQFSDTGFIQHCQFEWSPGRRLWTGTLKGERLHVQVRPTFDSYLLSTQGYEAEVKTLTRHAADLAACLPRKQHISTLKMLLCPMPGLLKAIHVKVGQTIVAGDVLCIVEAMKMEHAVRAESNGIVKTIHAHAGDLIGIDTPILEFA